MALLQRTFGEEKEKQLSLTIEMRVCGWNATAEVPGGIFFLIDSKKEKRIKKMAWESQSNLQQQERVEKLSLGRLQNIL